MTLTASRMTLSQSSSSSTAHLDQPQRSSASLPSAQARSASRTHIAPVTTFDHSVSVNLGTRAQNMGRSLTRQESQRVNENRSRGADVFISELESISSAMQGRRYDPITGKRQVIMQSNIGGLRPDSDKEVDELIGQHQQSIMNTASVMIADESWICSHFNEE